MAAEAVSAMEAKLEAMRKELEDLQGAMKVKDGEIDDLRKQKQREGKQGAIAHRRRKSRCRRSDGGGKSGRR